MFNNNYNAKKFFLKNILLGYKKKQFFSFIIFI